MYTGSEGFQLLVQMAGENEELRLMLLTCPSKLLNEGFGGFDYSMDMTDAEKAAIRVHLCETLDELVSFVFIHATQSR